MKKGTPNENTTDRKLEIYKLVFDHNDREWEMLWQRNGHFLVANSAFMFTIGFLNNNTIFAFILSILGLLLALIWTHSNREAYAFNFYWIHELRRLEKEIDDCIIWTRVASKEAREQGRPSTRFSSHGTYISIVFVLCWASLAIFFLLENLGVVLSISSP